MCCLPLSSLKDFPIFATSLFLNGLLQDMLDKVYITKLIPYKMCLKKDKENTFWRIIN